MDNTSGRLKVFIIDDDLAIRQSLKILLTTLYGEKFDIYSSGDGVEGLGMLYILNPDLIIIDTTLPTYSGRELIDYVTSNGRFVNTKLVVIDDRGDLIPGINPNIKILSKNNLNFVKELENTVTKTLGTAEQERGVLGKIKKFLIRKTFSWANRSDLLMFNISKNKERGLPGFLRNLALLPLWVISQIVSSIGLSMLYLFTAGRIKDANIPQAVSDNKAFRVLAYPTLIGVLTTIVFLLIQVALFIGGGIVIFNSVRLESIFANNNGEIYVNFNNATYDNTFVELVDGNLRLKEQYTRVPKDDAPLELIQKTQQGMTESEEVLVDTPTESEAIEPVVETVPETATETNNLEEISDIGDETSVEEGTVQGVSDELDSNLVEVSAGYTISKPSIVFNESIEFSRLIRIEEDSSVNTPSESIPDTGSEDSKRRDVSLESLKNRVFAPNTITYQLSPNNADWYYFNANNVVDGVSLIDGWERTEQGFVSSNTVQEVNEYLSSYIEAVGGNSLFLRIYIHSDGQTQVSLNSIKVLREQSIVALLNEEVPEREEDVLTSFPITFPVTVEEESEDMAGNVVEELPIPTIFQATYINGNKFVYGKILDTEVSDEQLEDLKVRVYYTNSTDIKSNALDKVELIGETEVRRNDAGDLMFILSTPNRAGGFVTAELVYSVNNSTFYSNLSRPLENSTFTVDSTDDTADHTLNGVCSAGTETGGVCTLRAAIAEANYVAGPDNIFFNIPTSDTGYRDYDTPDTLSSGDGIGGDDYWTIRLATALPAITETTLIDGATQETNSGVDRNIGGPDIEVRYAVTTSQSLLVLESLAGYSLINHLVLNTFGTASVHGAIHSSAPNLSVTRMYIGTDVIGNTNVGSNQASGIIINGNISNNVGGNQEQGNVLGGLRTGIMITSCTPDITAINHIKGNRIGLGKDGVTTILLSTDGINTMEHCRVEIGGESLEHRNYLSGLTATGILVGSNINTNEEVLIYNNFFGTDVSGTLNRKNLGSGDIRIAGNTNSSTSNFHRIGGPGKGNLFRFSSRSIWVSSLGDVNLITEYNTFSDSSANRAILIDRGSSSLIIRNNAIGAFESDPYFNLSTGPNLVRGIEIRVGGSPTIQGNIINSTTQYGISLQNGSQDARTSATTDIIGKPTIGGQNELTGSLCNGLEQNCIYNNYWGGIYSFDAVPANEPTLWADNDFSGGNGLEGQNNIEQVWSGLFELHSSNYRRTDLTGTALLFPAGTLIKTSANPSSIVTSGTAINVTCLGTSGVSCPTTGHTVGTLNNTHIVVPSGQTAAVLSNSNNWFRVTEYIYDGQGNKINYGTFKFDQPHFSSPTFTFDGNSTNNIINTGTSRTIDTQTYTDRGEPWTDKPLATRNIATGDIGRFQIMEVEYVDANPILQEDGSYIITVDSTEDIALATGTAYTDDGEGTASGGMSKLSTTVLANGKTSLREAVYVANNRIGYDNIYFNIPTADPGYINADGSRQSTMEPPETYPITESGYFTVPISSPIVISGLDGLHLNGYSQQGAIRNTAAFGEILNSKLKLEIAYVHSTASIHIISSTNNRISGLSIRGGLSGFAGISIQPGSYNWIEGNYIETDINGMSLTNAPGTTGANIRVHGTGSKFNIIGTNGDGVEDVSERNLIMSVPGTESVLLYSGASNNYVSGNYIGTDKTGRNCPNYEVPTPQPGVVTFGSGGANNVLGTDNDGVSDQEEGNIIGCPHTSHNAIFAMRFTQQSVLIQGNYFGISPKGDSLMRNNQIAKAILIDGTGENGVIMNNTIGNTARGINFSSTTSSKKIGFNSNIIKNIEDLVVSLQNSDSPLPNDPGDHDTGPNNLMNYPEIQKVTYLSGGKYRIEGILDNNVEGEGPFDIEICISDNHSSGHGGCIETLGYFENAVPQISGGINPWSVEITVEGDNGTQHHIFSSLATNALGSTSEFSANFNTQNNPNFTLASYPITLTEPLHNAELTDSSPILKWDGNGDLDLKHYEIYINGTFYALVPANKTELQIPYELPTGIYSWQVVGVRNNNTESGRSGTNTFKVLQGETIPVSSPILEPITELPPVSFIPREEEMATGIGSVTPTTILVVAVGVTAIGGTAGGIVFIKRKRI